MPEYYWRISREPAPGGQANSTIQACEWGRDDRLEGGRDDRRVMREERAEERGGDSRKEGRMGEGVCVRTRHGERGVRGDEGGTNREQKKKRVS